MRDPMSLVQKDLACGKIFHGETREEERDALNDPSELRVMSRFGLSVTLFATRDRSRA